MVLDRGR